MKILSADQIKELDAYTIQNEPVSSIELMERAAKAATRQITNDFTTEERIHIFCGPGNNGGDGLAMGRLLNEAGYTVHIYKVEVSKNKSEDFEANLKRLKNKGLSAKQITSPDELPILNDGIIIDALFGSGLTRQADGIAAACIKHLNESKGVKIAIDIPSGLFTEDNDRNTGAIFEAEYTLTFQLPKLAFFFAENSPYTGEVRILPIGLSEEFIDNAATDYVLADRDYVRNLRKPRHPFSHKGTYGHSCIVAGSLGQIGAAVLAGKSCLKSGSGLVTMRVPKCGYEITQTLIPEAMCIPDDSEEYLKGDMDYGKFTAVGIGPGIGTANETRFMLEELIRTEDIPVVLDADALNIMVEFDYIKRKLTKGSILTPHPGEFKRLFGDHPPIKRLEIIKEFTSATGCYLVYKDHYTFTVTPEGNVFFNNTGNPGMATGGSGDVLTGLITGLYAQGYSAQDACVLGVYLHGTAGDIAVDEKYSAEALCASDLIDFINKAWLSL